MIKWGIDISLLLCVEVEEIFETKVVAWRQVGSNQEVSWSTMKIQMNAVFRNMRISWKLFTKNILKLQYFIVKELWTRT